MNSFKKLGGAALAVMMSAVVAADYYRYRDENGQMHVTFALTQAAIKNGYDVINDQGVVVEHVPAATATASDESSAEQRAHDLRLLSTYGSTTELEAANERRISVDEQTLESLKSRLKDVRASLRATEDRAGLEERQSGEVSESTLDALSQYQSMIQSSTEEIAVQERLMRERHAQFEADRQRLQQLLGEI